MNVPFRGKRMRLHRPLQMTGRVVTTHRGRLAASPDNVMGHTRKSLVFPSRNSGCPGYGAITAAVRPNPRLRCPDFRTRDRVRSSPERTGPSAGKAQELLPRIGFRISPVDISPAFLLTGRRRTVAHQMLRLPLRPKQRTTGSGNRQPPLTVKVWLTGHWMRAHFVPRRINAVQHQARCTRQRRPGAH